MSKKTRKRFLSLLLGLAMVLGTVSLPGTAATVKAAEYGLSNPVRNSDNTVTTWDCVWFGSYPQTEIVGEASQSGVYQKDFVREGDYIVNASLYDKLSKSSSWNAKNELLINGVKYKRVQSSDACYVNENIGVSYANFDWNNAYHYFRYDPIKWRVLKVDDGIALLLADKVLDCKRFNEQETEVPWEDSTLRSWLNGFSTDGNTDGIDYRNNNFVDAAFSEAEQQAISESYVLIDSSAFEFTYAVSQVTILSKGEVCNKAYGFLSDKDAEDGGRKSVATAYSRAMGIRSYQTTDCFWWTNSSGKRKIFAEIVSAQGDIYSPTLVVTSCEGVRPALYLKLSSSEWSPAGKVCSDKSEREQYPESYYDVEFRATGAENVPADMTVVENQTVDIPVQYPQKFGANFKNWEYVYRTGIPPIIYYYQPGDLEKVTRNMILKAQWDDPIAVDNTFPKNYETSIRGAGEHVWYEFTPRISGVYDFTSSLSPDVDAMVTLYSEDGTVLRRDDDGGEGRAFKISEFLIEGKKYYFETSLKNSSAAGDFTITVDKTPELILPAVENKELYIDAKETFSAKTSGATMYRWDVIDDKYNHYSWDEVVRHATLIGRETSTLTIVPKDLWLDGKWLICYVGNSEYGDDTKPIQLSVEINPIQTGKAGDNATWTLNTKTGELKISGKGKLYDNSADEHWNNLDNFAALIKTVTIDEGITGGADGTFSYLSSVTTIKLPNTYEAISGAEFMFCRSLEEIWIPAGIKSIAGGSFYNDKNLKTVHFGGNEEMWKLVEMDRQDKYNTEFLNAEVICTNVLSSPVIKSLSNNASGVQIAWGAVSGAAQYRVLYKSLGVWVPARTVKGTSTTVTGLTSGKSYPFLVRCLSEDGKAYTDTYDAAKIKNHTYIAQPAVSELTNKANGVEVKWKAVGGAEQYRVFYKPAGGSWTGFENTKDTSLTVTGLTAGKTYSFTVRCLSADGKTYTSTYDTVGKSIVYQPVSTLLAQPVVSSLTNKANGVEVKWGAVPGAEQYRVFYRPAGGTWTGFGNTKDTSLTVTGLTAGTTYSFTVRCLSADGKTYTSNYDTVGKSIVYQPAAGTMLPNPEITALSSNATGVQVTWSAVSGASQYRVFYKPNGGTWTPFTNVKGTSTTVTGLTSGTAYSFLVRCLSADGKTYESEYDASKSKSLTYIAQPAVSSVANTADGVEVKWNAVGGAAQYRVFYKPAGGTWTGYKNTTGTSMTVTGLTKGTTYSFTVRCLSADGKTYTSTYDTVGKSITVQ